MRQSPILLLLLLGALLSTLIPQTTTQASPHETSPNHQMDTAQQYQSTLPDQGPLRVSVLTIGKEVSLGTSLSVPIDITNTGEQSYTPVLRHGLNDSAPTATVQRRAIPDELRSIPLPDQDEMIDPQLMDDLAAAPDGQTEFLVFLDGQPDLSAAYDIRDWNARGEYVYQTLVRHAEERQRSLREWLDMHQIPYRPLWIVNAIAVRGSIEDVQALAARHDVALLRANRVAQLGVSPGPVAPQPQQDDSSQTVEWNIRTVGAHRVWTEFGITGKGIIVANNDNGVQYDHPALVRQYRGFRSMNSFDHNYNWYDPATRLPEEFRMDNHGTHTMGTMVAIGNGTINQPAVGVAPGATWITARGCDITTCRDSDLISAAQWLLAPTDLNYANPRPDLRPHIINNSWAGSEQNDWYLGYVVAWRAAGIFPVFVTGNVNGGIYCGSVVSPGDYDNVVSVGATRSDDLIASFSRVGPTKDLRMKPDLTAPGDNIRSTVRGSTRYGVIGGTSMAAPHVAGTVALLWSANPDLIGDYDATLDILHKTAKPIIDDRFDDPTYSGCHANSVPNNIYGYGRLDSYAAVAAVNVDVPWIRFPSTLPSILPNATEQITVTLDARYVREPGIYQARILIGSGNLNQSPAIINVTMSVPSDPTHITLQGKLTSERTRQPISGVVTISDGPKIRVGEDGNFTTLLANRSEPYTITATATNYVAKRMNVRPTPGTVHVVNFALTPDVAHAQVSESGISAFLKEEEYANRVISIQNAGTYPLDYQVALSEDRFNVWRSDVYGTTPPTWPKLPDQTTTITLTDDGKSERIALGFPFNFYGDYFEYVSIYANGVIVLGDPIDTDFFFEGCLPIHETETAAIVPLRADFDPSQGGRIHYGHTPEGFLVIFEHVPLHGALKETFTFQVLLRRDGRIVYHYQQLGALPNHVAVGAQRNTNEMFTLGCGSTAPIRDNLLVELRPQAAPSEWLRIATKTESILAPSQSEAITVRLNWVQPRFLQPYRATLFIRSNDPEQPEITIPIELTSAPATIPEPTYSVWLPMLRQAGP